MENKHDIGLIGLAVMGANLARNIASRDYSVALYNRTYQRTEKFIAQKHSPLLHGYTDLKSFVASIQRPRKIIIMVQAGNPVDQVIAELTPLLDPEDLIIDCGNTRYKDTQRRSATLATSGISFIGCGVSGGEEGALYGPSLMPGGKLEDYQKVQEILESIAAQDFSGGKCVSHIATDGAGHYVKMLHNGIEYAIMQMMAEAYDLLRKVYQLPAPKIAEIFGSYNQGRLDSYLFEIAEKMLKRADEFNPEGSLVDYILDIAGAKGTGLRSSTEGLERASGVESIIAATQARNISGHKDLRVRLDAHYQLRTDLIGEIPPLENLIPQLEETLYAGMLLSYAQGLHLIQQAATAEGREINMAEITRIWQGGCIIRAKILEFLTQVYAQDTQVENILELDAIRDQLKASLPHYQKVLTLALQQGVATPSLSSGLNYLYAISNANSSANFIQGLRDYF